VLVGIVATLAEPIIVLVQITSFVVKLVHDFVG
jgi:hypothetical protein